MYFSICSVPLVLEPKEPDPNDLLSRLPSEIISHILNYVNLPKYLVSVSLVCKRLFLLQLCSTFLSSLIVWYWHLFQYSWCLLVYDLTDFWTSYIQWFYYLINDEVLFLVLNILWNSPFWLTKISGPLFRKWNIWLKNFIENNIGISWLVKIFLMWAWIIFKLFVQWSKLWVRESLSFTFVMLSEQKCSFEMKNSLLIDYRSLLVFTTVRQCNIHILKNQRDPTSIFGNYQRNCERWRT